MGGSSVALEMTDLVEQAAAKRVASDARGRLLMEFADAGKKARRRGQHVLWKGRLVHFDVLEGRECAWSEAAGSLRPDEFDIEILQLGSE